MNIQDLYAELDIIRWKLKRQIYQINGEKFEQKKPTFLKNNAQSISALDRLCNIFNLSQFERDILLLCIGMELDPLWSSGCAEAQVNPQYNFPTFSLAFSLFEPVDWNAIAPESPLRYWQFIEIEPGQSLTLSPLKLNERIFHFILGNHQKDKSFIGVIHPVFKVEILVDSHQKIVQKILAAWDSITESINENNFIPSIIQLCGSEINEKRAISAQVCHQLKLNLYRISSQVLPTNLSELNQLILLWRREAILSQAVLLLEIDAVALTDSLRENAINHMIEEMDSLLIVSRQDRKLQHHRQMITFEVNKPTTQEQQQIWYQILKIQNINLEDFVNQIVAQFNLNATEIQAIGQQLSKTKSLDFSLELQQQIWQICRTQAQPQMDELAQPIQTAASWEDLVLPELQKQTLKNIATHVKQRMTVYEQWGFIQKGKRGLGISALFAGASGTGKTMAAEVIAGELNLDLYRIDLSSVVSKYIGETEKNLRQVFDKAETGGAILLFDEADALFGKRSDVKDSRDRYANLEVSYLLQRMEAYRGLAILTTNLKESIDNAFMRRIRFIIKFPLPDVTQRTEIWRRIFPQDTPTSDLDFKKLAKLNLPGGNIRNIALNAAFLAADAGEPVTMAHLLQAAESEYAKLERPLTDTEVKGWV